MLYLRKQIRLYPSRKSSEGPKNCPAKPKPSHFLLRRDFRSLSSRRNNRNFLLAHNKPRHKLGCIFLDVVLLVVNLGGFLEGDSSVSYLVVCQKLLDAGLVGLNVRQNSFEDRVAELCDGTKMEGKSAMVPRAGKYNTKPPCLSP